MSLGTVPRLSPKEGEEVEWLKRRRDEAGEERWEAELIPPPPLPLTPLGGEGVDGLATAPLGEPKGGRMPPAKPPPLFCLEEEMPAV